MNKCLFKSIVLFSFLVSCFFLTSCKLFDLISDAINSVGRGKANITILTIPPFPDKIEGSDSISRAFSFSESIKDAFVMGFDKYNQSSKSSTHLECFYWKKADPVLALYKGIFSGKNIKKLLNEQLQIVKSQENQQVSCTICGVYRYGEHASSMSMQLIYYDPVKNIVANETGIIPVQQGRDQDSKLEDLLESLLKKVYR